MPTSGTGSPSLRERARTQVRADLRRVALDLFDREGFDDTTIADIARSAGISQRSFFRYFPTKEDVVLDAETAVGQQLAAALAARPRQEPAWMALGHTLRVRTAAWRGDRELARLTLRLLDGSPGLSARLLGRNLQWQRLLQTVLADRLADAEDAQLAASALVAAAFGCLDAAYRAWCEQQGADLDRLFDVALAALESLEAGGPPTLSAATDLRCGP